MKFDNKQGTTSWIWVQDLAEPLTMMDWRTQLVVPLVIAIVAMLRSGFLGTFPEILRIMRDWPSERRISKARADIGEILVSVLRERLRRGNGLKNNIYLTRCDTVSDMAKQQRRVRANYTFYDRLDLLLPAERTSSGIPSRFDFENYELPALVDLLAEDYEGVTLPRPDAPGERVMFSAGKFVHSIALFVQLVDGVVVITWLTIQLFDED